MEHDAIEALEDDLGEHLYQEGRESELYCLGFEDEADAVAAEVVKWLRSHPQHLLRLLGPDKVVLEVSDARMAASALASSSWPLEMGERMQTIANRIVGACDAPEEGFAAAAKAHANNARLRSEVRGVAWEVTTEADCYGREEPENEPPKWALYDSAEDDPPIAVFESIDWALLVRNALRAFADGDPNSGPAVVDGAITAGPRNWRCSWRFGPCVDGTRAGKQCDHPALPDSDRCALHTFPKVGE